MKISDLKNYNVVGSVPKTQAKQKDTVQQPKKNITDKIFSGAEKVTDFLGGKGVRETFGAELAKVGRTDQEKNFITQPSVKETAGSALQLGSLFLPVGGVAKGATLGAKAIGLGPKAAKVAGNVTSGLLAGATYDTGEKLQTGETSGIGTLLGGAVPLAGPVTKGISRIAGRSASEVLGKTTGAGAGAIKEGFQSSLAGGQKAKEFTSALRGNTSPEMLVEEAKTGLGDIIKQRSNQYSQDLSTIKTKNNVIDHKPLMEKLDTKLGEFGVIKGKDGVLDFSRAPGLGRYEGDLKKLSDTLSKWGTQPGDNTIAGIDKLKQVIDDFKIGSSDSRKFDNFVTDLRSEAKNLIKDSLTKSGDSEALGTYNKMLSNYEEKSGLIREIHKGLSLGDKASIDTSFKKLTSALRQNNEFRRELVRELDTAVGGQLSSKIAGQQLNPLLPRGISGAIGTVGGTGALYTGIGLAKLIPAIAAFSPRTVGELVNALGFVGRKGRIITEYLVKNSGKLRAPGDQAIEGIRKDITDYKNLPNSVKQGGYVKLPQFSGSKSTISNVNNKNAIKDSITRPSEMSIPKTFSDFSPIEQQNLTKLSEAIDNKQTISEKTIDSVERFFKRKGLNMPSNLKKLSEYIKTMKESSDQFNFDKEATAGVKKFTSEDEDYMNKIGQPRDNSGRFDFKSKE